MCPKTVKGRVLSMLLVQAEAAWAVELVHQTWQDQKHDTFFSLEDTGIALWRWTTVPAERQGGPEPRL